MPIVEAGQPKAGYAETNKDLRAEINTELVTQVQRITDVKRPGSLYESDSFHLDSKLMVSGRWKVEIQYKKGKSKLSGKTVAVVFVDGDAESLVDFRTAVSRALRSNPPTMYRVTA
jgi:hypothetical protein